MIKKAILKAYQQLKDRGWDTIYFVIDLHATCIEANYSYTNTPTKIFEEVIEPLQMLSNDPRVKLIMWTCSHPEQIVLYDKVFRDEDIHFDYFNENPEVKTEGTLTYGNYDEKFYFNVLIDDKAGFDPDTDWKIVLETLNQ
jgi:hypothetical protein